MIRCNYWDCGWCYAPNIVETNAEKSSACTNPTECPYMLKPEPPKPRLIEESFLPTKRDNLKMNWRIKKFHHINNIYYVIQKKNFFGFWYDHNFDYCYFTSYKQANAILCRQLIPEHTKIEYFEPDFDHPEFDECLPSPKNP